VFSLVWGFQHFLLEGVNIFYASLLGVTVHSNRCGLLTHGQRPGRKLRQGCSSMGPILGYLYRRCSFRRFVCGRINIYFMQLGCEAVINLDIHIVSFAVEMVWDVMLFLFYLLLWMMPQRHLFRRPAAILYAQFWCLFRYECANQASVC
jgi:hypothetical protein